MEEAESYEGFFSWFNWWSIVSGILILYFTYDVWCHTLFWRQGVKGPFPKPVFGNMFDVSKGLQYTHVEWIKKYGRVVGAYERRAPYMIISEPDILEKVLQKDFKKFCNRRVHELKSCPFDKSVGQLTDPDEWYQTRAMLTSSFTNDSLKRMFELMNENCSTLLKNVTISASTNNQPLQIKQFYDAFSMDVIANFAFDLQLDTFHNVHHPFVRQANRILQSSVFSRPIFVASMLPWVVPLLNYLNVGLFPNDVIQFFRETIAESVQSMPGASSKKRNLLNAMLEAKEHILNDTKEHTSPDAMENRNNNTGPKRDISSNNLPTELSTDQIMAQALGFLLAGYETTSTALCLASFAIATHPSVQNRLLKEIDQSANDVEPISYDDINKMEYLDMVIKESLRMYPPTVMFDRICSDTVQYNHITIPAGMLVCIPVWAIQRDSAYWPNPHKFNPERFKKQTIHPFTYLPFGSGPRNCIGMEFAILQIKLAVFRILQKYRLETCPETQIPPILGSAGLLTPPNGVVLRLLPR